LATVVLPIGILVFFDLSKISQTDESFHFYLEEKNNIPQEYINQQLTSKGFFASGNLVYIVCILLL
jgi:hypothetical protein